MKADAIPYFLSFCIEEFKKMNSITGEESMRILLETGALNYLMQNYEVIHTQSPQWIREEIMEYVNQHTKR